MDPEEVRKPVTLHSLAEILRKWKPAPDLECDSSRTWRRRSNDYSSVPTAKRRSSPDWYRRVSTMMVSKFPRRTTRVDQSALTSDDEMQQSEEPSLHQTIGRLAPTFATSPVGQRVGGFWRNCANIIMRKRSNRLRPRVPSNHMLRRFIPQKQEMPSTSNQREIAKKESQALKEWRLSRQAKARSIFGLPEPETFWLPHMVQSDEDVFAAK